MRFPVLAIDPPWRYNSRANHKTRFRGGACGHYPLMSMDQIKALPISDLACESAVLFMWATFPYLPEQIEVIKAWGFRYRTIGFLWTKLNPKGYSHPEADPTFKWDWQRGKSEKTYVLYPGDGLYHSVFFGVGYYGKSNSEPCLLATRGKVMKPISNAVSSIVLAPRREHSRKPDEVRERIVQLYGDVPKIELFARPAQDDDDSWFRLGNEMNGEDISVSMRRLINADSNIVMNMFQSLFSWKYRGGPKKNVSMPVLDGRVWDQFPRKRPCQEKDASHAPNPCELCSDAFSPDCVEK